jgi:hypothetical protein
LHKLLSRVADDYDWVVLDCPPGLGTLSEQIFRAADVLVVPVLPAPLALRTLEQVRERLTEARGKKAPPMLPILSMVDRRKALHREMVDEHGGWPAIPTPAWWKRWGWSARLSAPSRRKARRPRRCVACGSRCWGCGVSELS